MGLFAFVHRATWAHSVGSTLSTVIIQPYQCNNVNKITKISIALVVLFLGVVFIVVLIFTCIKHRWFT